MMRKLARVLLQRAPLVPPAQMTRLVALLTPSGFVSLRLPGSCPPESLAIVFICVCVYV